jgi:hypothetical protein
MSPIVLAAAAFGDDPGRWPLPAARSVPDHWRRAVAAGGQGRYATARADLQAVLRGPSETRWASLALSAQASFLRQLGWHRRAAGLDGMAWAQAGDDPEAGVDALAGLAADALGIGRLATSAALLERARSVHDRASDPPPRLAIRLAWVGAELAMAAGDGQLACEEANRAVELSRAAVPALRRHRVKSDIVLAAALCCAGDLAASQRTADAVLNDTGARGLVPLRWAVACLLAGIGSARHNPAEVAEIRDRSADFVTRHGGQWSVR